MLHIKFETADVLQKGRQRGLDMLLGPTETHVLNDVKVCSGKSDWARSLK